MATGTLEATLIPDSSILLQDEDKRPLPRCGERTESRRACSYEVQQVIDGESVVVNRGETVTLNRSEEGVLLVMTRPPHLNQAIEVHTRRALWGRTAHVYEARWAKSVHMESLGNVYLVGCRRVVGPCHYLSF